MEQQKENKMGVKSVKGLIWSIGLPMVFSMVLQALYNVVDTAFVINMGKEGTLANLALTYVFPIQILMIAVGVGTGIGINSILSRELGNKNEEAVKKITGNGIFCALVIYLVFLLFGIFGTKWYLSLQTDNAQVIEMGTQYLTICCTLSFASIGYNVYERLLQSTGKSMWSTIAQVAGAGTNIVLDYVFIYPCGMGIAGAAYATVIGQGVSLLTAMLFHYIGNKEIKNSFKALIPDIHIIGTIYKIGWSAILMQALLSVNMFGLTSIFGLNADSGTLIQGTFGIYYKIQQIALFAVFGLSNTIISVLAYNIGLGDMKRIRQVILWGIIDSVIAAAVITVLFESLAGPISKLFGFASGDSGSDIMKYSEISIRIASIGYVFMAVSVAIQGVLQAYRKAVTPLVISLLRLAVFIMPLGLLFVYKSANAVSTVWWIFPISEFLTAIVSAVILYFTLKKYNVIAKKAE